MQLNLFTLLIGKVHRSNSELDLVDYPQIVKNPMNLLKVQEKLKNR